MNQEMPPLGCEDLSRHEEVLRGLARALAQSPTLEEALALALAELERLLGLSPSRVYVMHRGGILALVASHGLLPEQLEGLKTVELGHGFTGLAAQRRRMVVMPVEHLDDYQRRAMLGKIGLQAVCALPLVLHREMVGVLNVATRQQAGFTPQEEGFLDILAGLLAAAVATHAGRERLEALGKRVEQTQREVELGVAQRLGELRQELAGLDRASRRLQDTWTLVRQAERATAVASFSSALAHELRSPLQVISDLLRRLGSTLEPGDPREGYLKVIGVEAAKLQLLIREVFKLNREQDLDYSEVGPRQALVEAFNKAALSAGKPREEPQWDLPQDLPRLVTDRELLVRALAELIQNALEATAQQGRLYLGATLDQEGRLVFNVGDSGPGLPGQDRERLFDPLYTTKDQGVGLGLPLCREVAGLLGGEIAMGDRPEGGALLQLKLPLTSPETRVPNPRK